jgi:hypothetical protein
MAVGELGRLFPRLVAERGPLSAGSLPTGTDDRVSCVCCVSLIHSSEAALNTREIGVISLTK